ncbi:Transcription factor BIM2 [Tetrabaena socialis]|uniref:Transcription factor BIM2 n=1 Tax=Tetrabaena socialis TaxID=47790 RepID=A0A2J7ZX20_9CHLO|nr:Transcription factor BIM2 [Tetrabaena socialis]|eukprot:PNH04821.1 Transcription factor BIM2 [Tetrabaena socialis]
MQPLSLGLGLGLGQEGPSASSLPPISLQRPGLSPGDLALLSHVAFYGGAPAAGGTGELTLRGNVGATRSSDSRSSSAYASRHQAAEQRRRTRINDRLELLRKIVPHAERANTACFLEEVIKYIETLKRRTLELEIMLADSSGGPVPQSLGQGSAGPPAPDGPTESYQSGAGPAQQQQQQQQERPHKSKSSAAAWPASLPVPGTRALSGQQPLQQPSLPQQPAAAAQLPRLQLQHHAVAAQQLQAQLQQAQLQQASQPSLHPQAALFQHGGAMPSLDDASLLLGGGLSAGALSQLTSGLQAQQGQQLSHYHQLSQQQQQLNELQTLKAMHTLQQPQQQRRSSQPAAFYPSNNKSFLHFNEDLFGGVKPELLPGRSLLGAASATPSTSLQITTAHHLPTESNALLHLEASRKVFSGSPVSSEECGIPLKKRKVLLM